MSKAFDTVNRKTLLKDLAEVLDPDELHLMHILINDVEYNVRVGNTLGDTIKTEIGIAQGDCLSAVLFIYYLARTLSPNRTGINAEHNYSKPPDDEPDLNNNILWSELDFLVREKEEYFEIDPKYADDTNWASTSKERIKKIKSTVPQILKARDLFVNCDKTEEHEISRESDDSWKKCKILGSFLDTASDIERRKTLTRSTYNKLDSIFNSKIVSNHTKIKVFNTYIQCVFLYNSELWTLTKELEEKIDVFQRNILRKILKSKWPRVISNEDLYKKTNVTPWSKQIKRRRLRWLGHLLRLHPQTPARISLQEFLKPTPKPLGRPKTTWLQTVKKDLNRSDKLW